MATAKSLKWGVSVAIGVAVVAGAAVATPRLMSWRATRQLAAHTDSLQTSDARARRTVKSRAVQELFRRGLDSVSATLTQLDVTPMPPNARTLFRTARLQYKYIEGMVEFYSPAASTALNGPISEEGDDEVATGLVVPKGFQLVEQSLFPTMDRTQWPQARKEVAAMLLAISRFRAVTDYVTASDPQILEIARLELARVSTLTIAGFDATQSHDGIVEAAAALDGISGLLQAGMSVPVQRPVHALDSAAAYLRAHPDFDQFDRFTFVTIYTNPAFTAFGTLRRTFTDPPVILRRTWPLEVDNVYDARGFDAQVFAPAYAPRATPALVALGRDLFFDPLLSGNGQRACASCHLPEHGFSDGQPRARPFNGDPHVRNRHTLALINAAYQPAQFADERAVSLEDQVGVVLASPSEMRSSVDTAVARLQQSAEYRTRFSQALSAQPDTAITPRALRLALAAYVRSLTGLHSRFDRAILGDTAQLQPNERRGFNLFMGKARCGTCHFAPLFNGTSPPRFVSSEVEVVGVPSRAVTHHATMDPDSGRGAVDRLPGHLFGFKTPTVRNVTLTAPYMHNGAYRTLDDVLDFYNRGGGAGIGIRLDHQTLADTPLHLTADERRAIIAFLGALVDTTGLTSRPTRLPRVERAGAQLAAHVTQGPDRPIGGRY